MEKLIIITKDFAQLNFQKTDYKFI